MSRSLNKVQLIGNLGADPEIRATKDGKSFASFSIATSDTWNDAQGQKQEKTEWHRVVVFGRMAEVIQQYVRKGARIFIEGKLQTRKWTDKQGAERYTTEIVAGNPGSQMIMLDGPRTQSPYSGGGSPYSSGGGGSPYSGGGSGSSYSSGGSSGSPYSSGPPPFDPTDYGPPSPGFNQAPPPGPASSGFQPASPVSKPATSNPGNIQDFDDDIPF